MARRRPAPVAPAHQSSHVPSQTRTANSGPDSDSTPPPRITLRHITGSADLASLTAVWVGQPPALSDLTGEIAAIRDGQTTGPELATAIWHLLVLPARAALHLGSWLLAHPLRLAVVALALLIITLTV